MLTNVAQNVIWKDKKRRTKKKMMMMSCKKMNSFRFIFFIPHCEQELCLKNKWKTILMICYRMITDGKCVFFFLSLTSYQMAYKLLLKQKTLKKITFFTLNNPQWLLFIYHNGFCFLLMPIQAIHLLNCWSHWSNLIYHILHTKKALGEDLFLVYMKRENNDKKQTEKYI